MKKILSKIYKKIKDANNFEIMQNLDTNSVLLGQILTNQQRDINSNNINDYEFKIFSQFGDDGIIQYLIKNVIIEENEKNFIEIGAGDYTECNTRFLTMKDSWQGLILDGSKGILDVKKKYSNLIWKNKLKFGCEWIKKENINEIISKYKFNLNIGLLSIDIDGNDYWIWKAIDIINPIIVIIEYNSLFGKKNKISVPYLEKFDRYSAHKSGLYWGSSISALTELGKSKGYILVGGNSAGVNLYFVRNDRKNTLKEVNIDKAYFKQNFSDLKDDKNNFADLNSNEKINIIKDLQVAEVSTNKIKKISDFQID